jgi:Ca2+-binding RTX toxin-like protein
MPASNLIISEVAPWSSGNSPVAQDWFELTNTGSTSINIIGWKFDDNSNLFSSAAALSGITSIGAGESVIFIEAPSAATDVDKDALKDLFKSNWFGLNPPANLQIGTYGGSGVGLSTGGDAVNIYNADGVLQANVTFGSSDTTGFLKTFDNAAGLNNSTITTFSAIGTNGAAVAVAVNAAREIGSPGTRTGAPATGPNTPTITTVTDDVSPVTGVVASGGSTNDTVLVLSGTADANSTVTLFNGSTSIGTATATTGGVWSFTTATPLSNGITYVFNATATNTSGTSAPSANYTVTVDTTITAGTLSLTNYTDSGFSNSDFISTDKSFALFLSGQESGSSVLYQVSTNGGGSWSSTASAQNNLADGVYQFRAVVTDAAGNSANTNTISLVVDSTAPNAPQLSLGTGVINGATASEALQSSGVITLTAESASSVEVTFAGTAGSLTKTVSGNGGTVVPVVLASADLVTLGNGLVTVSATATDVAGNDGLTGALTFTLDTVSPVFLSGPTPVGSSDITFTASETGLAALYKADSTTLFSNAITANTGATLSLVALSAITTTTLKISDGAGNLTAAAPTIILGTINADSLNGTNAADLIYGFAGNDTLSGGTGNDTLVGGEGTNSLNGGAGDDIFIVDTITNTITEDAGSGIDTVRSSVTFTLGSNLENLTLTGSAAINGTGNLLNNVITGNGANNVLNGSTGIDTLIGGLGNDTYVVDSITDTISEDVDAGIDTVKSSVNYTLGTNLEKLTLTGVAAINGTGNTLNNTLTGNGANNILNGGIGLDTLNGGAGVDTLIGGLGDDTYVVDSTTDTITEDLDAGIDLVQSTITYTLGANLEKLTLTGTTAIDGTGNTLNNVITGNGVNNILNGGEGIDTLIGGLGNDTYIVDSTTDTITEAAGAGIDTVQSSVTFTLGSTLDNLTLTGSTAINGTGNTLSNVISGNVSNNLLSGGTGNDSLDGGAGNDTLIGGAGTDNLTGGAGTDRFQFVLADSRLTASNNTTFSGDTITDYAFGTDVVDGPTAVTAANMASRTLSALATYTDSSISSALTANLTTSGTTAWAANRSALVTFGAGDTAQTFLVLGDATAGYQATGDAVFRFQFTGTLANFAIV